MEPTQLLPWTKASALTPAPAAPATLMAHNERLTPNANETIGNWQATSNPPTCQHHAQPYSVERRRLAVLPRLLHLQDAAKVPTGGQTNSLLGAG